MTIYEMRLVAVLGLLAVAVIAIVASLAVVHLQNLARRLKTGTVRGRTLPSWRGDAHAAARIVDRRQAAWRLRC